MPATAASAYRDGLSERSLRVSSRPSGRWATTSVKVPPRSTQNCQPFTSVSPMSRCSGPEPEVPFDDRSDHIGVRHLGVRPGAGIA